MEIKVICLNLWEGGLLLDGVADFLNREKPDVVLLQEVLAGSDPSMPERFRSIASLKQRLQGMWYDAYAKALIDNDGEYRFASGNATLSRFPITEHHVIPYDIPFGERTAQTPEAWAKTPRNLQHAVLDAEGRAVTILNTQGVWDLDGENPSERRKHMCQTIADTAAGKGNVIFAGDTNLNPTNVTLAPIDAILTPVFKKDELKTSFNVKRKDLVKLPGYATAVVDLMYVSPDVQVLAHHCPSVDISDHLPLVAVCKLS